MTNNRRAKHDARARMAETGEPYTVALTRAGQEEPPVTPAHLEAAAAAVEHLASNPAPAIPTTQRGVEMAASRFQDDDCANYMKLLPEGVEGLFCTELCKQTVCCARKPNTQSCWLPATRATSRRRLTTRTPMPSSRHCPRESCVCQKARSWVGSGPSARGCEPPGRGGCA